MTRAAVRIAVVGSAAFVRGVPMTELFASRPRQSKSVTLDGANPCT